MNIISEFIMLGQEFKGDIENVLIYMAEELTAIGEKEDR